MLSPSSPEPPHHREPDIAVAFALATGHLFALYLKLGEHHTPHLLLSQLVPWSLAASQPFIGER